MTGKSSIKVKKTTDRHTGNPFDLTQKQTFQVLLTLLLGGTVVSFSNSALNPAIPVFMSVFDVDIVMGGWVLNAYVLAMTVGLMLSGFLNKRFAFKQVYAAAITVFMLGSVVGMLASTMNMVIVARAIQGLSGGLIIPLSIGILYQIYPQQKHGRVMALWGIVIMMSLAFGPLVGAYLVELFTWWTLFAITIPLSVVVIIMIWRFLPYIHSNVSDKSFDFIGFTGLLVWLLAMMAWLGTLKTHFNGSLSNMAVLGAIAIIFLVTIVLWWVYESRKKQPLLNVSLFKNKVYLHSTIISITQTIGLMICLLILPVIIQDVMGESALWTGVILMLATLVASITSFFAGKRVDRQGARNIGIIGIIVSGLSTLMLAWCLYQPTLWWMVGVMSLRGVGVGLAYLPTTTVGFSSLPKEVVTEGAALNNISRRIFSTLFIALVTVYIEGRTAQLLANGSNYSSFGAIQEVFVFIAVILFLTIPSAYRLPKQALC